MISHLECIFHVIHGHRSFDGDFLWLSELDVYPDGQDGAHHHGEEAGDTEQQTRPPVERRAGDHTADQHGARRRQQRPVHRQ